MIFFSDVNERNNWNLTLTLYNAFSRYRDLYFEVRTGPSPSFVFTLSLAYHYGQRKSELPPVGYQSQPEKRENVIELIPIFKTTTPEEVVTAELIRFRLDYCFGGEPYYNISISTMADDTTSGLATYGCVQSYGECNTNTPFRDISGGPANFVQLQVQSPADLGPIHVLVRGDGRFQNKNVFSLAASAPRAT